MEQKKKPRPNREAGEGIIRQKKRRGEEIRREEGVFFMEGETRKTNPRHWRIEKISTTQAVEPERSDQWASLLPSGWSRFWQFLV